MLKGIAGSTEYKAAENLKERIEKELPKGATGFIILHANFHLFGKKIRDIDLVVMGKLQGYSPQIYSKIKKNRDGEWKVSKESAKRKVHIHNFLFTIEIKGQDARDVHCAGNRVYVTGKYDRDVTKQSEDQKYALKETLESRDIPVPWIENFIWFTSIDRDSLQHLFGYHNFLHNCLHSQFDFAFLMQQACALSAWTIPIQWTSDGTNHYGYRSEKLPEIEYHAISGLSDDFAESKRVIGESGITRHKLEVISRKLLKKQKYAEAIGERLIIISGRAGTGKTLKLLHIAYDLAENQRKHCLILTYNRALVSDTKRLLQLSKLSEGVTGVVEIMTLHSYFMELCHVLGICIRPHFIASYERNILELEQKIAKVLTEKKNGPLFNELTAWDYVMVDEAQDWSYSERNILYAIFGHKNIVISDGADQLVRRAQRCVWDLDLFRAEVQSLPAEKRSLRQKSNLVAFINDYAAELNLGWSVEANKEELPGGKVIISLKPYDESLHSREYKHCKDNKNNAYEYMFLVPPSLVEKTYDPIKGKRSNRFRDIEKYAKLGIKIWDGAAADLKTVYPDDVEQHRLFQYDSCRGLEAWTIVCLDFDEFVPYKYKQFDETHSQMQLTLATEDERRTDYANTWSLIPLTRAIDTLIILLKDNNSKTTKIMRKLHERHQDFVEFIE